MLLAAVVSIGVVLAIAACSALGVASAREASGASLTHDCLTGLSAGVLLAVAWLHLLDDAQGRLGGVTEYPAANAGMLAGFLLMAAVSGPSPCFHSSEASNTESLLPSPCGDDHCVADGGQLARFHVLEASISIHSILIGLGFGLAGMDPGEQIVFGLALCVHQALEGLALGMLGRRARLSRPALRCTFAVFTLSLPLGAVVAVVVRSLYAGVDDTVAFRWCSGLLNAFAAGTLTHIGVVMISAMANEPRSPGCAAGVSQRSLPPPHGPDDDRALDTMLGEPKPLQGLLAGCRARCAEPPRAVLQMLCVGLGATVMSVLAIWA